MAILNDTQINGNLNVTEDIQIGGSTVGDFVVEQGVSGIWTYRKWNSGISECWCRDSKSNYAITSKLGNVYYGSSFQVTFPTNLFVATPILNATIQGTSGVLWAAGDSSVYASSAYIRPMSSDSRTVTFYYTIHAIGKWK